MAGLIVALGACGTMHTLFGGDEGKEQGPGLEAPLSPAGGSAAQGSVRFIPRRDGVTMIVSVANVVPGQYRVLVHATGNCTSPNAFSAGPPWSPPGANPPLPDRIAVLTTNSEGAGTLSVRLAGVTLQGPNGLAGKSVVVHDRPQGPFDAQPGVRNDRIACGVIGALRTFF